MNYWIFQCKKERFDISDPSVLFDGMTGWWTANQYRSEMKSGDKVFFWLAGDKKYRGIYGSGELTSKPYKWETGENKGFSVDVVCRKRFDKYLPVNKIKENKNLESIQILNMPLGSNFLLNESEGKALESMVSNEKQGDLS
ncbi:MAG: EVE domain-containing protein [Pseudomonadota bacterium]|uniref:EVE domain-containing protein n=1 Tax=Gallaecimonas pentaromativorans TaxID=584787 RepID=UPI00067E76A6|nr:EVE domain-containing protein [Gallaecimonas pentaromativorans]MED5523927.1 EVE domain-containing protein [Pseudomonadota bacterium]